MRYVTCGLVVILVLMSASCGSMGPPNTANMWYGYSVAIRGGYQFDCATFRKRWWASSRRKTVIIFRRPVLLDAVKACKKRGYSTKDILGMNLPL